MAIIGNIPYFQTNPPGYRIHTPLGGGRGGFTGAQESTSINTSRPDYSIVSGAHGAFPSRVLWPYKLGFDSPLAWCSLGFDSLGDMVQLGVRFPWKHGVAWRLELWCGWCQLPRTLLCHACWACARIHANSFLVEMQFLLAPLSWGLMSGFLLKILKAQIMGVLGPSICQPCYRCPSLWLGRNSLLLRRLVAHSPAALSRGAMPEMFIAHLRSFGSLARARVALMAA